MLFSKKSEKVCVPSKAQEFNPILIKNDDGFYFYLPEMSVGGEGETLEDAYKQYELNLQQFLDQTGKYDLASIPTSPYPVIKNKHILQELTIFFIKSALSVFAVILVTIVLLPNISAAFRNQVTSFLSEEQKQPKYWAIQLPTRINDQLDRLDDDEEAKMYSEWNHLIQRSSLIWKPYKDQ